MPKKQKISQSQTQAATNEERYGFALQLLQYEISRLWTIYGLFLLAETVLLSAVVQVFSTHALVYAGSIVGILLVFPWWATFENTRKYYLLRLMQAKDFEPQVGTFLTEGHKLSKGEKITRERENAEKEEEVQMNWIIIFMRPQRSIWFLMFLFIGSFIGIVVLRVLN